VPAVGSGWHSVTELTLALPHSDYNGGDGLTGRVGETAPGYDSQVVSEGRHGVDSSLTRAPALCQNIKCSGRGSGCRSREPARASSEAEPHPRGRPALERGGVSPEGASSCRARWNSTRGGVRSSNEAESRWHGGVPLERSGVSHEGCRGRTFWWAAKVARAVGPCHRVVIALGVTYDLCVRLCFVICEKMGFPLVI
jgi:hypothetical protein